MFDSRGSTKLTCDEIKSVIRVTYESSQEGIV